MLYGLLNITNKYDVCEAVKDVFLASNIVLNFQNRRHGELKHYFIYFTLMFVAPMKTTSQAGNWEKVYFIIH